MELSITVNKKEVKAEKGELLLDVLDRLGIRVPTLCHMKDFLPTGSCRMCVVENKQTGKLITACSFTAEPGMVIETHSPRVIQARKTIVELLLSNHPDDCLYCVRTGNCDLQDLAREHHITERSISGKKNSHHADLSSASIVRAPAKCILCGRCIKVCSEVMGVSAIDFINRGSNTVIGPTFNKGLNTSSCVNCGQCIMVCPTGAISEKNHFAEIMDALRDPKKTVVVQYAPAISVTLAEEFGMAPGTDVNGLLNAALRKTGFDKIFDTTFAADLTIMEESAELIERLTNHGVLPMITSCCPAWIKYAEEFASDFLPNLSTCKSPQQMLGAVLKSYYAEITGIKPEDLYVVSIMPCAAKKFEGQREEMTQKGISDIDAVLTTRELVDFFRLFGIGIDKLEAERADSPHGIRSSAGKLFGVSGGVMEAALRTAYYKITNKELPHIKMNEIRGLAGRKEMHIQINEINLGVAVVDGLANANILLEEIRQGRTDIHFIEVMACPAGCIGGGGQPLRKNHEALKERMKALYRIDENESIKVSHKNPEVIELYQKFLGKPLGKKSHKILHTTYTRRDVLL
jgi:NADH-quinone oxidoreductase subunit G/NADP-reducing hydrogenase subunit HndD